MENEIIYFRIKKKQSAEQMQNKLLKLLSAQSGTVKRLGDKT